MGIGLRAAAKQLGISHVALIKAVKVGRVKKLQDGTFDVASARKQLERNSNPKKQKSARAQQRGQVGKGGQPEQPKSEQPKAKADDARVVQAGNSPEPASSSDGDYNEACRRLEWLKVKQKELDLSRKRGELVPIGEINAYIAGMITRSRDIFLRMGPELRDLLAQETDPIQCEQMVMEEIQRGLREIAEYR